MGKHTPGPWLVTDGTFVYALNVYGTNSFWANIYGGSQGGYKSPATPSEEIEANVSLIAAAPDLLDACETYHNLLRSQIRDGRPIDAEAHYRAQRKMEDAIAKARGQS